MKDWLIEWWRAAGADLGIRVMAPADFSSPTGEAFAVEVFLPDFGAAAGAVIVEATTERQIRAKLRATQYLFVSIEPARRRRYQRKVAIATLSDLGWFGVGAAPDWLHPN